MRNFRKELVTSAAGIFVNSLVDLHESSFLIACYCLELCRYHFCRLVKYPIPIMRPYYLEICSVKMFISETKTYTVLLQIKNTSCCLCSPLWNWSLSAPSGCQISLRIFLAVSK